MEEPKTPRPRSVGSARPRPRRREDEEDAAPSTPFAKGLAPRTPAPAPSGRGSKKTDYRGPMQMSAPTVKRNVGSSRPRAPPRRKLPKESYEGFNDMANEGFGMYGRVGQMQPKNELMMTENAHMPILTGNKGLPKILGMANKLKAMGYYKPKYS